MSLEVQPVTVFGKPDPLGRIVVDTALPADAPRIVARVHLGSETMGQPTWWMTKGHASEATRMDVKVALRAAGYPVADWKRS